MNPTAIINFRCAKSEQILRCAPEKEGTPLAWYFNPFSEQPKRVEMLIL